MIGSEIKNATQGAHKLLEITVTDKLKQIRSKDDYISFLKCFYLFFQAVENASAPFINEEMLPGFKQRRTSAHVLNDLEELGCRMDDHQAGTELPVITNSVQALGALYVLDGSVAGGPMIVKMLEMAGIRKGISFFSGNHESAMLNWDAFIGFLNKLIKSAEDKNSFTVAANETFKCFDQVFIASD
jgi:heme oxygenase (biliverdin-IX-beta and delta-forming)